MYARGCQLKKILVHPHIFSKKFQKIPQNPKNPKKSKEIPKNPKKSQNFSFIDQQNDQESIFFVIDSNSPYFLLLGFCLSAMIGIFDWKNGHFYCTVSLTVFEWGLGLLHRLAARDAESV
jgi:hypothetical protein